MAKKKVEIKERATAAVQKSFNLGNFKKKKGYTSSSVKFKEQGWIKILEPEMLKWEKGQVYSKHDYVFLDNDADNDGVWDEIDRTYVSPIIEKLKVRNFENLFSDIRNVLEQLELKYEVVYNGN